MLEKFQSAKLRPWQEAVLRLIRTQGPRKITFVMDENGNTGKTFLAKYILATKNALYFTSTSLRDVAYAWKGERYIVFDISREKSGKLNFSTSETIKNGVVLSTKYRSPTKVFQIPIMINSYYKICMINSRALAKMMSNDKCLIIGLSKSPDPLERTVTYTVEDYQYAQELEVK